MEIRCLPPKESPRDGTLSPSIGDRSITESGVAVAVGAGRAQYHRLVCPVRPAPDACTSLTPDEGNCRPIRRGACARCVQ
jgi:hypothetical protein